MTPEQALDAARIAAKLLLTLAPDRAHDILHEESVRETNRLADAAEQLKFPNG
jgi:hypothetical protein